MMRFWNDPNELWNKIWFATKSFTTIFISTILFRTNQPTSQHACHAEMGVWNSAFTLYVRFQTKVQHSSRRRGCVACSAEQIFNQLIRRHFNEW